MKVSGADRLRISGLRVKCRLGVFEWEQAKPQTVWIDLELEIDAAKASAQDDVNDAVDYANLISQVKTLVEHKSYRLMETMAEEVATLILTSFRVPQVLVRITKRALPGIESATVEITRRGRSRRSGRFPRGART